MKRSIGGGMSVVERWGRVCTWNGKIEMYILNSVQEIDEPLLKIFIFRMRIRK